MLSPCFVSFRLLSLDNRTGGRDRAGRGSDPMLFEVAREYIVSLILEGAQDCRCVMGRASEFGTAVDDSHAIHARDLRKCAEGVVRGAGGESHRTFLSLFPCPKDNAIVHPDMPLSRA